MSRNWVPSSSAPPPNPAIAPETMKLASMHRFTWMPLKRLAGMV